MINTKGKCKVQKKIVLLLDDSKEDTFLFNHAATKARQDIQVETHLHAADLLLDLKNKAKFPDARLPHLIFIDINMPMMNGMDFLQKFKSTENLNCIPAIMFSTSAYREDIKCCYSRGADGYLLKPSGNKELVEKLRQVFSYWIDTVESTHQT